MFTIETTNPTHFNYTFKLHTMLIFHGIVLEVTEQKCYCTRSHLTESVIVQMNCNPEPSKFICSNNVGS